MKLTNLIWMQLLGCFPLHLKSFGQDSARRCMFKLEQNSTSSNLTKILFDFLDNQKQRVVSNRHSSHCANVSAGVPYGSTLLTIYRKGLSSNAKLLTNDTCLFSVIHESNTSRTESNGDLSVIKNWAFQRKMSFHIYSSKQTQEVTFSRKTMTLNYFCLISTNGAIIQTTFQKQLEVISGSQWTFDDHVNSVSLSKCDLLVDTRD